MTPHDDCRSVLVRYPAAIPALLLDAAVLTPVTSGFSGAGVWRVRLNSTEWALRRWPAEGIEVDRLRELHRWLRHLQSSGGLPVSVPLRSDAGETFVEHAGSPWQLEPWLPGEPELHPAGRSPRVAAVMQTLTRLHQSSAGYFATEQGRPWFAVGSGPSPTLTHRLHRIAEWTPQRLGEIQSQTHGGDETSLRGLVRDILAVARRALSIVEHELYGVSNVVVPLLPCLRDARPEHMLLAGDRVTGIIDPSAARTDTVATDLSRLLAGYYPAGLSEWRDALEAYARVRPLSDAESRLIAPLDRSNALLSALHWVERFEMGTAADADTDMIGRVRHLSQRLRTMFG
jgi:Ser/Thr protein kinase RdoA (MazF antagonist)